MLLRPHEFSDIDRACDAAVVVVRAHGAAKLSVRSMAATMGVTPPALTQRWENRARLVGLVVTYVGRRWLCWAEDAWRHAGVSGLLPCTEEEILDTRVWLGLRDLGRTDPELSSRVADVQHREWLLVRETLEELREGRVPDAQVDLVHAAVDGLRMRVCSVAEPLAPADASLALESLLAPRA